MYLGLPLSDPRIVQMPTDEVELTYAFYRAADDDTWARFERTLGVTWTWNDVSKAHVPSSKAAIDDSGNPVEVQQNLLGRDGKVFVPLALALNGGLFNVIKGRFDPSAGPAELGSDKTVLGDGTVFQGENMFHLSKEEFQRRLGVAPVRTDHSAHAAPVLPNKKPNDADKPLAQNLVKPTPRFTRR